MGRESRQYWEDQLSEYRESGFSIQKYSELKALPYESVRRWGRVLQKAGQNGAIESESLELVEVASSIPGVGNASGIKLTGNLSESKNADSTGSNIRIGNNKCKPSIGRWYDKVK